MKRVSKLCGALLSLVILVPVCRAQNPSLSISTAANLQNGVSVDHNTLAVPCILSVAPTISVKALGPLTSAGGQTIPLSKIHLQIVQMGTLLVLGQTTEIALSTSNQVLGSFVLGAFVTNTVQIRYKISAADMASYAFKSGTYTTTLEFTSPGGTLCLGTRSDQRTFTLTVSDFTTITAVSGPSLVFRNASDYSNGLSADLAGHLNVVSTADYGIKVNSSSASLSPNAAALANRAATLSAGLITVKPSTGQSGIGTTSAASLSTTAQAIVTGAAFANTKSIGINYSISSEQSKLFKSAGIYSVPVQYSSELVTAGPEVPLTVEVKDISAITVGGPVSLSLSQAQHYLNGVSVLKSQQIQLTRTSPFNIYVKASSGNLMNGAAQVPVSLVSVQPKNLPADFGGSALKVKLSATPQAVITGASPGILLNFDMEYAISSQDTPQLLNKPNGTYTITVTYSFVAE